MGFSLSDCLFVILLYILVALHICGFIQRSQNLEWCGISSTLHVNFDSFQYLIQFRRATFFQFFTALIISFSSRSRCTYICKYLPMEEKLKRRKQYNPIVDDVDWVDLKVLINHSKDHNKSLVRWRWRWQVHCRISIIASLWKSWTDIMLLPRFCWILSLIYRQYHGWIRLISQLMYHKLEPLQEVRLR